MERKGYELVVSMLLDLVQDYGGIDKEGKIQGVFDMSKNEVLIILRWNDDAGPNRWSSREMGILSVAPGNVDNLIYTSIDLIPERFKKEGVFLRVPLFIFRRS